MKLYRVCGVTEVCIYKEVWANSEDEAIERANKELYCLTEYCGNGGYDKLVGVARDDESVAVDNPIDWNDTELLKDDPDYRECPDCHEELVEYEGDNGEKFWKCEWGCGACYDEDYNEVDPDDYFDETQQND